MVLTTKSTLTASSVVVARMLLGADKTAHYLQTAVAGIWGFSQYDAATNASGQISGNVAPAGVATGAAITYSFPSMGGAVPQDSNTNRNRIQVYSAGNGNFFDCALDSTASAATPALNNTLAGFILTVASGVTTYTIDTGAAAADQCLEIIECDTSDPLYGSVGGRVFFRILPTFDQGVLGVPYSSN